MAFGGFTANRGDPVSGETRPPKTRQWSGIRVSSFRGKLTGKVRHAAQYAPAARDSTNRIFSGVSAFANSERYREIVSAALVASNL